MTSEVFNTDCLEYMRTLPDKAFQLAIADPPYGIGEDGAKNHSRSVLAKSQEYTPKDWDSKAPDKEFFNEQAKQVIEFCKKHKKFYHIKKGTITE